MNPSQIAAAHSSAAWNVVLAGPGSGKTTVQIERAKFLKCQGARPQDMAFVTFTNAAANVLKRRLADSVGPVGFVGTLHGMMLGALRKTDPRWVIVNEDDADAFLLRFSKLLGYSGPKSGLERAKSGMEREPSAARVIAAYRQFMRDERLLDYDMILSEGLLAIKEALGVVPWRHFFVDEFQDSGPMDLAIYRALRPASLFITADADQAIYRFRGACPENVAAIWGDPEFQPHILDLNYRCAESICEVANAVIEGNVGRVEKRTVSATGDRGIFTAMLANDDASERRAVADIVRRWISNGVQPTDIAVLCRTNRTAEEMAMQLKAGGIPVTEAEVEKKPKDWRLLNLLLSQCAAPQSWGIARLLAREAARLAKGIPDLEEAKIDAARTCGEVLPPTSIGLPSLKFVLSTNADFSRFGVGTAAHRILNARIRLFEPTTYEELLEALRAEPEALITRGVNVKTVHAAKGEEYRCVAAVGLDEFHAADADDMQDERRLFFVAATRAKECLAIFAASYRRTQLPNGMARTIDTSGRREVLTVAISALRGREVAA